MYRTPSGRKRKKEEQKLNLIPILDAIFIFIFFLLMSANFIKVNEIQSDVPIISSSPPPKVKKKPLALTVTVKKNSLIVMTGVPAKIRKVIKNKTQDSYDMQTLHDYLLTIKKSNLSENTVILEPKHDVPYEVLIKIMDSIRLFNETDEAFFFKDKDGISRKIELLFGNIVFGNIMS
jgi:biopolymer transport protein ExbD